MATPGEIETLVQDIQLEASDPARVCISDMNFVPGRIQIKALTEYAQVNSPLMLLPVEAPDAGMDR